LNSARIVITGGTGFLGRSLGAFLAARGYQVVLISRHQPDRPGPWSYAVWDGQTVGDWAHHLDGCAGVVNLACRSVDCRKTPDHCDEILRSRVDATLAVGAAIRAAATPPPVWVQMSTAHIYGDPPAARITEDSEFGYGLAPFVGRAWEAAFERAAPAEIRKVILRTSFVLGRSEGALRTLERVARLGLGGKIGHGRQVISWIHEADMNRLFFQALTEDTMSGAYIASAPQPVSNAEFMRALRKALRVPIGLPAAEWMVRLAAPVLRTDPELAIYGRYCTSRRLAEEGYEFEYPEVSEALRSLYATPELRTENG
jgi:uncharacterized protein